ncbi:hypothetical protein HJ158_25165 [Vibrio parahaemolyticus]|nr:hypothetical protein [Vibrio parahaemolyticus]
MFQKGIKALAKSFLKVRGVAVLPCFYEAKRVMGLALNPHVGGFYGVTIVETNNDITHERAEDWLLEH